MFSKQCQAFGIALVASSALFAVTARAQTASTVNVKLDDSTSMAGMNGAMKMEADRYVVPAGKVTIRATNESKALIHELLVIPETSGPLPYNAAASKLVESGMNSLGEVDDLKPGASGFRVFTLKPGKYYLICNQPGHFKAGMYTELTVVADKTPITNASNAPTMRTLDTKETPLSADDEGS